MSAPWRPSTHREQPGADEGQRHPDPEREDGEQPGDRPSDSERAQQHHERRGARREAADRAERDERAASRSGVVLRLVAVHVPVIVIVLGGCRDRAPSEPWCRMGCPGAARQEEGSVVVMARAAMRSVVVIVIVAVMVSAVAIVPAVAVAVAVIVVVVVVVRSWSGGRGRRSSWV